MNTRRIDSSVFRYACIYVCIFLLVLGLLFCAKNEANLLAYNNVEANIHNQMSQGLSEWESLLSSAKNFAYILQDDTDILRLSTLNTESMKNEIPLILRAKKLIHGNWLLLSNSAIDAVVYFANNDYVLTGNFVDSSFEKAYGTLISFDDFALEDWLNTIKNDSRRMIISPKVKMSSAYLPKGEIDTHLLTYKLYRGSYPFGFVSLVISSDYLNNLFLPNPVEKNQLLSFYDPSGNLVYSTGDEFVVAQEALAKDQKFNYQGEEYSIVSVKSTSGYRLAAAVSNSDIAAQTSRLTVLFRVYMIVGIVCFVLFIMYLSFYHLHPLNKLLYLSKNVSILADSDKSTYAYIGSVINNTIESRNQLEVRLNEESKKTSSLLLESGCMRSIYTQKEHDQIDEILSSFSQPFKIVLLCTDREQEQIGLRAIAEIEEAFAKEGRLFFFNSLPHEYVYVIGEQTPAELIVKSICTRIKSEIDEFNLSVGISNSGTTCEELHSLFMQAKKRTVPFMTLPSIGLIEEDNVVNDGSLLIEVRSLSALINLTMSGHREDILTFFDNLSERVKPFIGTEAFYELLCVLRQTLIEAAISMDYPEMPPSIQSIMNDDSKYNGLCTLKDYCLLLSEGVKRNNVNADYNALWKYIENNVTDINLSAKTIGEKFGYSEKYVYSLMKQLTGQTVSLVIENIRMGKACEYLKNTDMTIEEICEKTGFGTKNTFFRLFKKHFNMTPKTWREAQKNLLQITEKENINRKTAEDITD